MKLDVPNIARGATIPHSVEDKLFEEIKEKELRKIQFKHDWKIATFGVLGGAVAGFISSYLFWIFTSC